MAGIVTHYKVCSAPTHYFSEHDVGQEFVRIGPHCGDWSYTPRSSSISEIRAHAMKLVEFREDYLKFLEKDPFGRNGFSVCKIENRPSEPRENWNDGGWISVEKLARGLSAGDLSIKSVRMMCAGWDDWD